MCMFETLHVVWSEGQRVIGSTGQEKTVGPEQTEPEPMSRRRALDGKWEASTSL